MHDLVSLRRVCNVRFPIVILCKQLSTLQNYSTRLTNRPDFHLTKHTFNIWLTYREGTRDQWLLAGREEIVLRDCFSCCCTIHLSVCIGGLP